MPRIAKRTPRIPSDVLAVADDATADIARFDAELSAEVAPFASVLLRSESASSSMIENLTAGARAIALAELGSTERRNATEIVGNVAAMRAALELETDLPLLVQAALAHAQSETIHPFAALDDFAARAGRRAR